jgi:ribosomal protein L16/L10AE
MLTQQAKQTRMGKGKGSISLWFYASSAGSCLFEISSINKRSIQLLFQNFSKKYSMNSTIMQKNK